MHFCVVQEERIELLDKLEQFPLKIRVKEEQDSILRWAPFLHLLCIRNVCAHVDELWCCICACQQETILRWAGCCIFSALAMLVPMSTSYGAAFVPVNRRATSGWQPAASLLHLQCLCPRLQIMVLHLCLSTGQHPQVGSLLHLLCTHNFCAHVNGVFKVLHVILACFMHRCICMCACQQVPEPLSGIAMPFVLLHCPVSMCITVVL